MKTIFGEYVFLVPPISKKMTPLGLFLEIFSRYQLNIVVALTKEDLKMIIFSATTIWDMPILLGFFFKPCVVNSCHGAMCGVQGLIAKTLNVQ